VQRFGNDQIDQRIAEKLQPFIVGKAGAAVTQRLLQEIGTAESMAEAFIHGASWGLRLTV
jgi:hypothetical protein